MKRYRVTRGHSVAIALAEPDGGGMPQRGSRRRGNRLRLLFTAASLVAMAMATSAMAVAMPGVAAALPGQTLFLEPSSGPVGTSVTATASGFGGCPPTGADDASPGTVEFLWDGADFVHSDVQPATGSASASFVVPESAALATHRVEARCVDTTKLAAFADFAVTPPEVSTVIAPNLLGKTRDAAVATLEKHHLLLGATTGNGERVASQDPSPGTEVELETAVDLDFGTAPPRLVEVPGLVGRTTDDAAQLLGGRGLELGSVLGRGDVVGSQRPVAGTAVAPGTAVDVTVTASPPPLVKVPDLVGGTRSQAETALSPLGLLLGPGTSGGAKVESQQPPPGTLVPVGTTVTVSLEEPTRWIAVAAGSALLLALLAGGGLAGFKMHVKRSHHRWVRAHVKVVAGQAPGEPFSTTVERSDDGPPTTVVALQSHIDTGSQVVEEMKP